MLPTINDFYLTMEQLFQSNGEKEAEHDKEGLSSYGRCTIAILHWLKSRRHLVRTHTWALRHILRMRDSAFIHIQIPDLTDSIFHSTTSRSLLNEVHTSSNHLASFTLISPDDLLWHRQATQMIGVGAGDAADHLLAHLRDCFEASVKSKDAHDALVFSSSVQLIVSNATVEQADCWVTLARRLAPNCVSLPWQC
jgi:hypothetical protein